MDEIMGIPTHPLVVHAAVVLTPMLALAALVYALVPRVRPAMWWAVAGLAVAAPLATLAATFTGERLVASMPGIETLIGPHAEAGEITRNLTGLLGLASLGLWLTHRAAARAQDRPALRWQALALTVVVVLTAVAVLIFVVRAGHSGSDAVWGS
ncbi:DUF2231 domain-containing protein [Pilimelia columellifera]|uniref:DUF2231 domain-containing protein n=1 Tax=Pilimelia columellifera subsp. columellifera TaxID=706583 RepID=A0ABN3NGU5_9ACTN